MNITMKRQDIIDKLNELMPAFKAEDKRLQAIYKTEFTEYSKLVKQRVRELNKMSTAELTELLRLSKIEYYIQTGKVRLYSYDDSGKNYQSHNKLAMRTYYTGKSYSPITPGRSWAALAEGFIKHLELASTRSFTLSQDGRYPELYMLVTFEPYTETA